MLSTIKMDYTITETFTLPSLGKIYPFEVKPQVKLRSMTVDEEMQRLSHSDYPYKTMCDVIDKCIVDPIGISSYELCVGDYQYLLHKLRIITYGSSYPTTSICPICGTVNKTVLDLDTVKVKGFGDNDSLVEEYLKSLNIELPQTKKRVKIKIQTPHDLDEILNEVKEFKTNNPESTYNYEYLSTLRHYVDTIDDKKINKIALDLFLRKLPMGDANFLRQKAIKLNDKVGIDTNIKNKCSNSDCGATYASTFRLTSEFFGPSIDG